METELRVVSSAIAIAAMVLIWNEAPIAESPSDHEFDHRMAYSERSERQRVEGDHEERSPWELERVGEGGPTGVGPKAEPAAPDGGAPNVAR